MDQATIPDRHTIRELASWPDGPVASVYVPIEPAHRDADRVMLKAALQWVHECLTSRYGLDDQVAAAITGAASLPTAVPSGSVVWFLADGHSRCVTLPVTVGPSAAVGGSPDVVGLVPFLDGGAHFVLALSQHRVRLFRAGRYRIEPIVVPDLPKSLEEALWFVRREPTFERHGSGAMHASGSGREWHKDDVQRFVELVDRAIFPVLRGSTAPLVVMGVGYEAAMFVNATRYRHVLREVVEGNPDSLDAAAVHSRSWNAVRDRDGDSRELLAAAYELVGTGLAVVDPTELLSAAESGAVANLLVSPTSTVVPAGNGLLDGRREMLCRTVLMSAANGAAIVLAPDDPLPDDAPAVALLRR